MALVQLNFWIRSYACALSLPDSSEQLVDLLFLEAHMHRGNFGCVVASTCQEHTLILWHLPKLWLLRTLVVLMHAQRLHRGMRVMRTDHLA